MTGADILSEAFAALILKGNYWAGVLSQFNIVEDELCNTIGLRIEYDGSVNLIYSESFINKVKQTKDLHLLEVIFEHEGLHILNKHIERTIILSDLDNFVEENCQISCDLAINPLIEDIFYIHKQLGFNLTMPNCFNLPDGLLFEEYYDILNKNQKKEKGESENGDSENTDGGGEICSGQDEGDSESGCGQPGSPTDNGDGSGHDVSQQPINQNSQGQEKVPNTNTSDHRDWIKQLNGADQTNISYQLETTLRNIIGEATDSYVKSWGSVPGNIEHLIEEFLSEPRLPYYHIIKRYAIASRHGKQKVAYSKINRKRMYCFTEEDEKLSSYLMPFPGKEKDRSFNIGVLIDTSMSVPIDNNGIHQALSGIQQILNDDPNSYITLLQVDTEIKSEEIIKKTKDINKFEYQGGGGTCLLKGLYRLKHLKCDITIVFTDGCFTNIHDEVRFIPKKIIWVLPENGMISSIENTGPIVFYPLKEK